MHYSASAWSTWLDIFPVTLPNNLLSATPGLVTSLSQVSLVTCTSSLDKHMVVSKSTLTPAQLPEH